MVVENESMCPADKTNALTDPAPADAEADQLVETEPFGPPLPIAPAHPTDPPANLPGTGVDLVTGEGNTPSSRFGGILDDGSIAEIRAQDADQSRHSNKATGEMQGTARETVADTSHSFMNQIAGQPLTGISDIGRDLAANDSETAGGDGLGNWGARVAPESLRPRAHEKEAATETKDLPPLRPRAQVAETEAQEVGRTAEIISLTPHPRAQAKTGARRSKRARKSVNTTDLKTVRPRAQRISENQGAEQAEILKSWLKEVLPGWWDVTENGKGFVMSFRWRAGDENPKQPFPRLSRRAFNTLKEMDSNERRSELRERVAGHLEELLLDQGRRDRARVIAARLGIKLENDSQTAGGHLAS